ncbi:MAG: hypothetical protein GF311_24105 [Candidatus Lokiarchaeota archaeon]|nr:hypothetical protein [Candidatus Lokiarchaeota archaeon]
MLYVYHGILLVFMVFLVWKTLSRSRRRINLLFSMVFIFIALGLLLNMIYGLIAHGPTVLILNFLTNYFIALAPIYLVLFNFNLIKKRVASQNILQLTLFFTYALLLFGKITLFISNGVRIDETTNWFPEWTFEYLIYVLSIKTIFTTIPFILTSIKLYLIFEHKVLRKRWISFVIGAIGLILYMDFNFSNNFTSHPIVIIGLYLSIIGIIPSITLIYYGVGKQLN